MVVNDDLASMYETLEVIQWWFGTVYVSIYSTGLGMAVVFSIYQYLKSTKPASPDSRKSKTIEEIKSATASQGDMKQNDEQTAGMTKTALAVGTAITLSNETNDTNDANDANDENDRNEAYASKSPSPSYRSHAVKPAARFESDMNNIDEAGNGVSNESSIAQTTNPNPNENTKEYREMQRELEGQEARKKCCPPEPRELWKIFKKYNGIYVAIIVHLGDVFTDYLVLIQYIVFAIIEKDSKYDEDFQHIDYLGVSICSILAILLSKTLSSYYIYIFTNDWKDVLLNIFDFYFFKEIAASHKSGNKTDLLQYLQKVEKIYESTPQFIIQTYVFVNDKTEHGGDSNFFLIQGLSIFISVFAIANKLIADDKKVFIEKSGANKGPKLMYLVRVLFRICEVLSNLLLFITISSFYRVYYAVGYGVFLIYVNFVLYRNGLLGRDASNILSYLVAVMNLGLTPTAPQSFGKYVPKCCGKKEGSKNEKQKSEDNKGWYSPINQCLISVLYKIMFACNQCKCCKRGDSYLRVLSHFYLLSRVIQGVIILLATIIVDAEGTYTNSHFQYKYICIWISFGGFVLSYILYILFFRSMNLGKSIERNVEILTMNYQFSDAIRLIEFKKIETNGKSSQEIILATIVDQNVRLLVINEYIDKQKNLSENYDLLKKQINTEIINEHLYLINSLDELENTTFLEKMLELAIEQSHESLILFILVHHWIENIENVRFGNEKHNILAYAVKYCLHKPSIIEQIITGHDTSKKPVKGDGENFVFAREARRMLRERTKSQFELAERTFDICVIHRYMKPNKSFRPIIKYLSQSYWPLFLQCNVLPYIFKYRYVYPMLAYIELPHHIERDVKASYKCIESLFDNEMYAQNAELRNISQLMIVMNILKRSNGNDNNASENDDDYGNSDNSVKNNGKTGSKTENDIDGATAQPIAKLAKQEKEGKRLWISGVCQGENQLKLIRNWVFVAIVYGTNLQILRDFLSFVETATVKNGRDLVRRDTRAASSTATLTTTISELKDDIEDDSDVGGVHEPIENRFKQDYIIAAFETFLDCCYRVDEKIRQTYFEYFLKRFEDCHLLLLKVCLDKNDKTFTQPLLNEMGIEMRQAVRMLWTTTRQQQRSTVIIELMTQYLNAGADVNDDGNGGGDANETSEQGKNDNDEHRSSFSDTPQIGDENGINDGFAVNNNASNNSHRKPNVKMDREIVYDETVIDSNDIDFDIYVNDIYENDGTNEETMKKEIENILYALFNDNSVVLFDMVLSQWNEKYKTNKINIFEFGSNKYNLLQLISDTHGKMNISNETSLSNWFKVFKKWYEKAANMDNGGADKNWSSVRDIVTDNLQECGNHLSLLFKLFELPNLFTLLYGDEADEALGILCSTFPNEMENDLINWIEVVLDNQKDAAIGSLDGIINNPNNFYIVTKLVTKYKDRLTEGFYDEMIEICITEDNAFMLRFCLKLLDQLQGEFDYVDSLKEFIKEIKSEEVMDAVLNSKQFNLTKEFTLKEVMSFSPPNALVAQTYLEQRDNDNDYKDYNVTLDDLLNQLKREMRYDKSRYTTTGYDVLYQMLKQCDKSLRDEFLQHKQVITCEKEKEIKFLFQVLASEEGNVEIDLNDNNNDLPPRKFLAYWLIKLKLVNELKQLYSDKEIETWKDNENDDYKILRTLMIQTIKQRAHHDEVVKFLHKEMNMELDNNTKAWMIRSQHRMLSIFDLENFPRSQSSVENVDNNKLPLMDIDSSKIDGKKEKEFEEQLEILKKKYGLKQVKIANKTIENSLIIFYNNYISSKKTSEDKPTDTAIFLLNNLIFNKEHLYNPHFKHEIFGSSDSDERGLYLFHSICRNDNLRELYIDIAANVKYDYGDGSSEHSKMLERHKSRLSKQTLLRIDDKIDINFCKSELYLSCDSHDQLAIECIVFGPYNNLYQEDKYMSYTKPDVSGCPIKWLNGCLTFCKKRLDKLFSSKYKLKKNETTFVELLHKTQEDTIRLKMNAIK